MGSSLRRPARNIASLAQRRLNYVLPEMGDGDGNSVPGDTLFFRPLGLMLELREQSSAHPGGRSSLLPVQPFSI